MTTYCAILLIERMHDLISTTDVYTVRARMLVGRYKHEAFSAKLCLDKHKMCRLCGTSEVDAIHMISTWLAMEDL